MSGWLRPAAPAGVAVLLLVAGCASGAGTGSGSRPAAGAAPQSGATPAVPAAVVSPSGAEAASVNCSGRATPAQTEGPYFKAGSPERASLWEAGMAGTRLQLTGHVVGTDCRPLAAAVLDFWQADASGVYDNSAYRLRGHQSTDAAGAYSLATVIPGEYPGRTEHIHVKVQAPGRGLLTTQLYFPGVARNQSDSIFDPALVMQVAGGAAGRTAAFDFVL